MNIFKIIIVLLIAYGIIACGMTLFAPLTEFISGIFILFCRRDSHNHFVTSLQSKGFYLVGLLGNAITTYHSPLGIKVRSTNELNYSRKECNYYHKHHTLIPNDNQDLGDSIGRELIFNGVWFVVIYVALFILITIYNYNPAFHSCINSIVSLL